MFSLSDSESIVSSGIVNRNTTNRSGEIQMYEHRQVVITANLFPNIVEQEELAQLDILAAKDHWKPSRL